MSIRWSTAMDRALYGPDGFFVSGSGPAGHFRTSVHASPVFAAALLRLVEQVDAALGHPPVLTVVDVGAGRGELLRTLAALAAASHPAGPTAGSATPGGAAAGPAPLADRIRLTAAEKASRPGGLPEQIDWVDELQDGIVGLLVATEWLDNVPLDVAVPTADGWRYLLVEPATGVESLGEPVSPADAGWLATWWPATSGTGGAPGRRSAEPRTAPASGSRTSGPGPGPTVPSRSGGIPTNARAEIGRSRDAAWAGAVGRIERGLALAVDYGHLGEDRPLDGTLTGYRGGRQVPAVPDGTCDVTAHVALDSVAATGERVGRSAYTLVRQREALRALGADGRRPPLSLAGTDPAGYVRALAAASTVAELTDPAGLGGHWWLLQPVGVEPDGFMARWRA